MIEFLAMDGYAKYVWSAFGISLLVLFAAVYLNKRYLTGTRQRVLRRILSQEGKPQ
jgi:heme exporter protein CcmD